MGASLLKATRAGVQLFHGLIHFKRLSVPDLATEAPEQLRNRAIRLQKLSRDLLYHLGVEIRTSGHPSASGLLISNHVSFADIMVLSASVPTVFVSKAEVAQWPAVGPIAAAAGPIFIQRQRRADVARANTALHRAIEAGLLVTLFPEGTTSDGQQILPFQPSLLQPAIETQAQITPAFLRYREEDGSRIDEVAYFGERHLQDCLWALVRRQKTIVSVRFGETRAPEGNRKTLASLLHAEITQLSHLG
jgi:1-acyl-sn-glycerol-3-phosphate acyltransferase